MNKYENLIFVINKHIPNNLYSQDVIKELTELGNEFYLNLLCCNIFD